MTADGNTSCGLSDAERYFVSWAFECLGWKWREERECVELTVPESDQAAFGQEQLRFSLGDSEGAPGLSMNSTAVRWLHENIHRQGILHAAPAGQPTSVHEISPQLFAAYQAHEGTSRLVGCQVEYQPLIRFTRWNATGDGRPHELSHRFAMTDGTPVEPQLQHELGLEQLVRTNDRSKKITAEIANWIQAAEPTSVERAVEESDEIDCRQLVTLIWCTFVKGKIEFEIRGATDTVEFSGWARPLAAGTLKPPPFRCQRTGDTSYELAATDGGLVTTVNMVGRCESCGDAVMTVDLHECSVSGSRVCFEHLALCPVSGAELLPANLVDCLVCLQQVSPHAVRHQRCQACNSLRRVSKDDPRMARILGEHPRLDRWPRWRIGETSVVYVLTAAAVYRRLLVVVDKESLELIRIAVGNRFSSRWVDAPVVDQDEYSQSGEN